MRHPLFRPKMVFHSVVDFEYLPYIATWNEINGKFYKILWEYDLVVCPDVIVPKDRGLPVIWWKYFMDATSHGDVVSFYLRTGQLYCVSLAGILFYLWVYVADYGILITFLWGFYRLFMYFRWFIIACDALLNVMMSFSNIIWIKYVFFVWTLLIFWGFLSSRPQNTLLTVHFFGQKVWFEDIGISSRV